MNSGIVRLDQVMSKLLTLNNYRLQSFQLNLSYIIIDQRKFAHLQKLANQPTLNDAHVVEMEVSHSMVARCREKRANWKKKQKMVKKYI